MPTYDYKCSACSHTFEHFQSMKDKPLKKCPGCGKNALERLIGTGAAVIFKGSGFYQTDYRSEGYKKAADADKPQEAKADTNTDAKADSRANGKSEAKTTDRTPASTPPSTTNGKETGKAGGKDHAKPAKPETAKPKQGKGAKR